MADLKELIEELKKKGIEVAEEQALDLVSGVFDWMEKTTKDSDNKWDDFLFALVKPYRKALLAKIDEWDGEKDLEA